MTCLEKCPCELTQPAKYFGYFHMTQCQLLKHWKQRPLSKLCNNSNQHFNISAWCQDVSFSMLPGPFLMHCTYVIAATANMISLPQQRRLRSPSKKNRTQLSSDKNSKYESQQGSLLIFLLLFVCFYILDIFLTCSLRLFFIIRIQMIALVKKWG